LSTNSISLGRLALHNVDAIVAVLALPVFVLTGLPVEGWFWATVLWAVNRFLQARVERKAAAMEPLRGVGVMGASMLLRPWIGMLLLFLITRHDPTMAISATIYFLVLLTIDILTRVATHKNVRVETGDPV
jgi:hypothetical protein